MPNKLGVMMLVHSRAHVLAHIFSQMPRLGNVHLQVTLSRPSSEVLFEIDRLCRKATRPSIKQPDLEIEVLEAPFNPLDDRERFMEMRRWQAERLPEDCDYGCIWDDDHVLENPTELRKAMLEGFDLAYATKIFFWDTPKTYTTHLPRHRSVFAYRVLCDDVFPLDRVIHAPSKIHDTAKRIIDLKGALLDYGYMRDLDRQRCWADYKRVGKIDAATVALVKPPRLVEWTGHDPFVKKLRTVTK